MKFSPIQFILFYFISLATYGQNELDIKATFTNDSRLVSISQTIVYTNTTDTELSTIYLNDWINSYATKNTPLANRFAEEFKSTFHFAKKEDRGFTVIKTIKQNDTELSFSRLEKQTDVIKVELNQPLKAQEKYTLQLEYTIQVPNDKFTRYGITDKGDFNLRYWYITPAVYNGKWQYYSNKSLDDAFIPKANLSLEITYPKVFTLTSELNEITTTDENSTKITQLKGDDRINTKLVLKKNSTFNRINTNSLKIITDIDAEKLEDSIILKTANKVATFVTKNIGDYPHEKMLLTEIDYKKDPIYGLNLLPDFIRPFPNEFQYELKLLKTILHNHLENTLLLNPRKDQWLVDGIQIYYLMKYVEEYYPDMKILGALANIWGIRFFHAADLKFNEQYPFLYMNMARTTLDQPITMPKDSLLKFNENIANKYKTALGFKYLNSYLNSNTLETTLAEFLNQTTLQPTNSKAFETLLKSKAEKNIDWFFEEYLSTNKKIDYKIKQVRKTKDSITITIKNKRDSKMPISLYTLKKDSVISKKWIEGFENKKTITIANNQADKLALNYDQNILEHNMRNNWKSLKKFHLFNKPLKFKLIKDVEDSKYNQVFFMPDIEYNFYDGLITGMKLYNKTILSKDFYIKLTPQYANKSKQLVGSTTLTYIDRKENKSNYYTRYGLAAKYFNYAPNLSYSSFTPFLNFRFRNEKDLRDNSKKYLNFRAININREIDPTGEFVTIGEPKYSVFNASYAQVNPTLKNYQSWITDLQFAKNFGKISTTLEFRKLTENNRQYNFRVYSGAFLYNSTHSNSDFFSFALDRPTDYLFDYNYIGRSEETGLLSQQLIIAEGGFKSKLNTPFANQWLTTVNTSTTIWRYIMAYGDVGVVKSHGIKPTFVYDSGIRLNLVEDYFELYLPVYSNLGWEVGQPNYSDHIRFIVTLSPSTLIKLFTRRWY